MRGPIAEEIAGLTWFLTVLGLVVYLLVLVLFVVPMWRRRRAAADEPDPHAGESVPAATANRWIVLGGVVLPVLVLPVALGVSVATMRDLPFDAPSDALVVDVTGHRWWWSVHYPDHGVTLANEIHIPVGRPVELRLASTDVIHSFWVPKLAGKIDALP
ncbi:MAG: cytochrome c oxidase subunit II, partial [Actinobacteria bacterium]|nr:cytochrome c oxidase subunit II [Actinomycetota bacterium]